jgi:peptidoglycan/LPS O-acetylase OafA/YrhL
MCAVARENNFNLIRMAAALAVMVTHSFALPTGNLSAQPFASRMALGAIAVDVFFVTSGFLVTASLLRRSLIEFAIARVLRIYPALIVMCALTVLVLGPAMTSSGDYFNADTWRYAWRNALIAPGAPSTLPGVFDSNPMHAVNGSLWTLPYEVRMYVALAVLGIAVSWIRHHRTALKLAVLALAASGLCLWMVRPDAILGHLGWMFFAGALLQLVPVRISGWVALALLALTLLSAIDAQLFKYVYALALPYVVIAIAEIPKGPVLAYNRLGDYSYGVYIYAFPVEQMVIALKPHSSPASVFLLSAALTLPLAALSWHLIEKQALGFKARVHSIGFLRRWLDATNFGTSPAARTGES